MEADMFTKPTLTFIIASLSSFIFFSCSNSFEPEESRAYMQLNVGDLRQIILAQDSSTILMKITGTGKRTDGLKIYFCEHIDGTSDTAAYISNYALKDGYFISTELDTVRDIGLFIKDNPYREQRLAKLYPMHGESWNHTKGDSSNGKFSAQYTEKMLVPAGEFKDVFQFHLDNFMTIFYAKGVGYIATYSKDNTKYMATYLKINGKEYGMLYPPKNYDPLQKELNKSIGNSNRIFDIFGNRITR